MKYRIKQIGFDYYPQKSWIGLFWSCFTEDNGNLVSRDSLRSARAFINVTHTEAKVKSKVAIHTHEIFE